MMSFLFELLLTAFFSFLIASLLAKLFTPSSPSSSSCHGAADVINRGTHVSGKEKREREREEVQQQEKIIEVDKVVERETEREFLGEKERLERDLSVEFEEKGDGFCLEGENRVLGQFGLTSEVGFEKEKVDHERIIEKSCEYEKEKELFVQNELMVKHNLVADSYNLIFGEDQMIVQQEETVQEVKDSVKEKDGKDNICELEGSTSKMTLDSVHTQNSLILQEQTSDNSKTSEKFEKGRIFQDNLNELEGPDSKIPQQKENSTDPLILNEQENEKDKGQEKDLSKTEGPTCKTTPPLMEEQEPKEEKEAAFNEEEEWEGIERSETEKRFSVAANFATDRVVSKLSDDVQLKLYGLNKVATEGPCYESSSMALRASTRAKWNAWQRLGNMNPEMAMEQYMTLLSQNVPNWTGQPPNENIEEGNERERSSEEIKNYSASDQLTTESQEGLSTSESTN